ncbi:MAG: hypothetical protein NVS3B26_07050 [Mycobacteriales bacterium]
MKTFLFQAGVQLVILALIWVAVARDATKLRETSGRTPAGISPFAWGALCGLTWVALIGYFRSRKAVAATTPRTQERNLLRWWIVLTAVAAAWSASNAASSDANDACQHAILAAIFVVCALIAWSGDRAAREASQLAEPPSVASDHHL